MPSSATPRTGKSSGSGPTARGTAATGFRSPPRYGRGRAACRCATTHRTSGLATAPLSDTIEVDWPRQLLTDLLAGVGVPYVVVRLGYGDSAEPVPPAPRRRAEDVIEVSDT
ncbi:hypothetical protein AB0368_36860 [Actinoplanes sp. NPDC051475]|uniref:hypothetical protein n=1 Tax=Actinoplanes sp. NPDC051475 TaxID=3157225 RepID=UPI00344B2E10